jgi:primosomal protein N' (replication factor Y) (superfamily II helicase)
LVLATQTLGCITGRGTSLNRVSFGTVVPLVPARALSGREFTYELRDGAGKGAVVSVPFGRSRARGVVVEVVDAAPVGVKALPVDRVLDQLPPTLVDLALWVADYYGSTPARALELVAPVRRQRRKEQASPVERQSLEGEAAPARLSDDQEAAVARIGEGGRFLLYGPTGSGKTEVYLQAAARALERGLGTIVLVPEIALTPQTVGRFRARFGDSVALLHSALTDAERRDERERIAHGEARVVVGARSAIFAPMRDVGLICVDEEHDPSYKQESDPRYDARTVAAKRAALEGAAVVYGSATPRPESWAALERLELRERIGAKLPPVKIVDLRREAGYPLSAPLLAELGGIAERGGKAILLLNRRGIAPALHCRACGTTFRCPDCDVSLTLHRDQTLRCHHCGHSEPVPSECPSCRSVELARIGAGTQKLERELATRVPELELIRLDADTVAHPEELAEALRRFRDADRAVLLGTQMVAKGHHFSGVELAAVVDADTGLGLPDLRAEERTFQLVTQLAGRSGRDAPGRVLVQTFQPDARPLALAARHDVPRFLADELERRRELGYPPFRHLVRILVTAPSEAPALKLLQELRGGLDGLGALLGPAPVFRLRGKHRAQLVAKTVEPRRLASRAAQLLAAAAPAMRRAGLTAVVDVDPQQL